MTVRIKVHLVALMAILGGCASAPIYAAPSTPVYIRQESTVLILESLRASERQRLRNFLERASRGRRDALHLLISGSPRLGAEAVHQAKQMGIDANNIQLLDQHDGRTARIEVIVYHARPADCPSVSSQLPSDESVDLPLGCSTRHNLAVMVNDPRDLFDNKAVKPSDGDRAAIPVAKYRTFTAEKSAE
ncbi:CpaD family pilus assembly lipoprotein [Mesorhizobium sp. WSM3224]|uniref:CpaD family pilus assembly lipoprotein n=1 Tax=Mesorhizobium sp. WSM3224 TaxID=1040986 RepID=UPI0004895332|nr:CpaD family pilus assembly lipoprotein [Mesorhizobium sp. WSM3224]